MFDVKVFVDYFDYWCDVVGGVVGGGNDIVGVGIIDVVVDIIDDIGCVVVFDWS